MQLGSQPAAVTNSPFPLPLGRPKLSNTRPDSTTLERFSRWCTYDPDPWSPAGVLPYTLSCLANGSSALDSKTGRPPTMGSL